MHTKTVLVPQHGSMVRFNFSPGVPNRQSRRERLEQAKRDVEAEQTRRRNFGFLKNAESRMSTTSLNRTREHAKQLAMVYDDPVETPTSVNSGQGLLNFDTVDDTFDPFGHNAAPPVNQYGFSTKRTVTNASMLDQHFATSNRQDREATASTLDSFDTMSVGSAYDMDFLPPTTANKSFASPSSNKARKSGASSLDQFVERTKAPAPGPGSFSGTSNDRIRGERSVTSMPTFPSNSSMQASFARQTSTPTSTSSAGAAARRRFRNQLRHSSSNGSVSSSVDDSSYHSGAAATPPESPASSTRNITGSAGKNRVAAYQRSQNSSFYSQASSTGNNSNQSSSQKSGSDTPNLFDPSNLDGGFTFDAFGLDQSQIEREVNEAMQALAGQGVSGFSVFFNNDTDGDFPVQAWDSPAGSRRSSPAPSDSEYDGFVDGFRVTESTPNRSITYSTSSPASSEPSFSSPVSRRLARSHANETTPPRWEDSPKTKSQGDVFGTPTSNPWKDDPWGSGDEGNYFSDSASNSDFAGTQSEILAPSFADTTQFKGNFPGAKSDIGVSTAYQKSVSFHQDVRSPRNKSAPVDLDELSSSSEESDTLEDDKARHYAQEFVKRISPRHANQNGMPTQDYHAYGQSSQSLSNQSYRQPNVPQHEYPDEQAPLDEVSDHEQEQMFHSKIGSPTAVSNANDNQLRNGAYRAASSYQNMSRQNEDELQESFEDQQQQLDYGPPTANVKSQPKIQNNRGQQESETRFSSFRTKYELSRGSSGASSESTTMSTSSDPKDPSPPKETLRDYGNLRNAYDAKSRFTTPGPIPASNPQTSRERIESGSLARTSNVEFGSSTHSSTPSSKSGSFSEIDRDPKLDQSSSRMEEKKDEDESAGPGKINSLKSKWQQWESKPTVAPKVSSSQPVATWNSSSQRPQPGALAAVEMLTPDMVEARRQEKRKSRADELRRASQESMPPLIQKPATSHETNTVRASYQRANECQEERTSFASLRERLKPANTPSKAKSDVGLDQRSSIASSVVDRLRRESPMSGGIADSKSDAGSSPSFLANVKLRKTGNVDSSQPENEYQQGASSVTSPNIKGSFMSYGERMATAAESGKQDNETPVERKLTYRERRELELKREQAAKSKLEVVKQEEPKKDVAALIRKRIAANKQKPTVSETVETRSTQVPKVETRPSSVDRSVQNKPTRDWQTTNAASHHSSPNRGSEQVFAPLRVDSQSRPSPKYSQTNRGRLDEDDDDPTGSILLDNLSPTSAETNLTYSTENSPSMDRLSSTLDPSMSSEISLRKGEERFASSSRLDALLAKKAPPELSDVTSHSASSSVPKPVNKKDFVPPEDGAAGKSDVQAMLSSFLGARNNPLAFIPAPKREDDADAILYAKSIESHSPEKKGNHESPAPPPPPGSKTTGLRPPLKDDPKYERYFRMLKVGMPMEVVKHAMLKDGNDPSVMDGDHNKPVGLPLKEDPKYVKYFKMLKMGISMPQVKHAMERDGLNPEVMDQDHNLPADACEKMSKSKSEPEQKDTHRRARLHWKPLQRVTRNSLWSKMEPEATNIDFDEEEFKELFQADITPSKTSPTGNSSAKKKGAAVRVIDAKRANNGGIILARVKMSHDEMADAVDRIDGDALTAEQIENIIEYLPTKEERIQLEKYMLEGGLDAAQKFDGLCECEKFMVSMMTVKHAKRKVNALLFKLQFISCLQSIAEDAQLIDDACDELQHSTRLRQLLGIVLQFGNRLNTAGKNSKNKAGAFTLDSLLKLSQAKAFDKKTTFLHYVVMIVHRNNEILLNFTDDLPTVLKADKVYWDQCLQDLEEVENQLENVRRISLYEARALKQRKTNKHRNDHDDDDSLADIELTLEEEVEALRATPTGLFTLTAIKQVSALRDKVEATRSKFMRVLEYFGEDKDSMQPHELFNIFCVFGRDFNKAKEEAFANMKKKQRDERKKAGRNQTANGNNGKPPSGPERKPIRASNMQPHMNKVINDFRSPPRNQPVQDETNRLRAPPRTQSELHSQPSYGTRTREDQGQQKMQHQEYQLSSEPSRNQPVSRPTGTTRNHLPVESLPTRDPYANAHPQPVMLELPVPRGMQESGRFEEVDHTNYSQSPQQYGSSREASAADTLRQKAKNRRQRQVQISKGRTSPVVATMTIPESRSPSSSPSEMGESDSNDAGQTSPTTSGHSRHSIRHRRIQAMKRVNSTRNTMTSQSHGDWEASSQLRTN